MTRYCGREFTPDELEQIQSLIKHNPGFNRTRLSTEVCQILQWLKPDGKLKDMSCRVAMLRMDKDGLIQLPPSTRKKQPVRTILFTPATDPPRILWYALLISCHNCICKSSPKPPQLYGMNTFKDTIILVILPCPGPSYDILSLPGNKLWH